MMVELYRIFRWNNGFREYFQYLNYGSNGVRIIFTRSVVMGYAFTGDDKAQAVINLLALLDPYGGELLYERFTVDDFIV